MADLKGQRIIAPEDVGALALSSDINVVYGTVATKLDRPLKATILVLRSAKGLFTVRLGDRTSSGMPSVWPPAAQITDNSGAWVIPDGAELRLPAPKQLTVKGYAADSALLHQWL